MSVLIEIMMMRGMIRYVYLHGIDVDQQPRVIGLAHTSVLQHLRLSFDAYEPCKCQGCCRSPGWRLLFLPQR